jgi:hypothetical protein
LQQESGTLLSLPFPNARGLSTAGLLPNISEAPFTAASLAEPSGLKPKIPPCVSLTRKFLEITTFPRTLSSAFRKNVFSFFVFFALGFTPLLLHIFALFGARFSKNSL